VTSEARHLWLIRFYAAVIIVSVGLEALEGGALKLVVTLAGAGIILQSFLMRRATSAD
jgi:hypothetical protein